jgi:hypothetical protein
MLYTICRRVPPLQDWYFNNYHGTPLANFFSSVEAYVYNRWIGKEHLLRFPQVKKGGWMETDDKMFHAVFELLVDFVEGQAAHVVKVSESKENETYLAWKATNPFKRWWNRSYWNEQFGRAWLQEYINDKEEDFERGHAAETLLGLYDWYKRIYPLRQNPFSGFKGKERTKDGKITAEFGVWAAHALEQQKFFYADDTRKAQLVLELRSILWT